MKFNVDRDKEYIEKLQDVINCQYNLKINKIVESSRGVDGETWIAYSNKNKYFIKIAYYNSHKKKFINSINTLNILNKNNIRNINKVIKTKLLQDYIDFEGGMLAIYSFVDGSIDYNHPYNKIIKYLTPIYKLDDDISMLKYEDFNVDGLINTTKENIKSAKKDKTLNKILSKYSNLLSDYFIKLGYYYSKVDKNSKMFITHGDACVNVMVSDNRACLIDWDDTLVAPIERDCWFFIDSYDKITYINEYLDKNGVDYTLSYGLLAFYAYKSALVYLNEAISKYFEIKNNDILIEIEEILNGWVSKKIESINNN